MPISISAAAWSPHPAKGLLPQLTFGRIFDAMKLKVALEKSLHLEQSLHSHVHVLVQARRFRMASFQK